LRFPFNAEGLSAAPYTLPATLSGFDSLGSAPPRLFESLGFSLKRVGALFIAFPVGLHYRQITPPEPAPNVVPMQRSS